MKQPGNNRIARNQHGLTLVEMMVALLISTVLLAGVVSIFVSSKQSHKLTDSLGFMQEAGRMAINTVATDLRRAGFWGGNKDLDLMTSGSVDPVTPTALTFNTCNTADDTWARMFTQRIFGLDDSRGGYACVPSTNYTTGTDVVVARYATAHSMTDAELIATPNTLYIRTAMNKSRVFYGVDYNDVENAVAGATAAVYPVTAVAYYIGTSSETCNGVAIPALFQVTLGDNGLPSTREIVSGVEDLQVQYGLDTDGTDGVANQYLDAGAVTTFSFWNYNGIVEANKIVSARVWLVARAACEDPTFTNTTTYTYADRTGTSTIPTGDHFRRQIYSATIALRN